MTDETTTEETMTPEEDIVFKRSMNEAQRLFYDTMATIFAEHDNSRLNVDNILVKLWLLLGRQIANFGIMDNAQLASFFAEDSDNISTYRRKMH